MCINEIILKMTLEESVVREMDSIEDRVQRDDCIVFVIILNSQPEIFHQVS